LRSKGIRLLVIQANISGWHPDVFPGERLRCEPGSIFPGQFNIRAWVKIKEFKAAKKQKEMVSGPDSGDSIMMIRRV
jgi:hypothetical protein